jgi:hypothetical protein
LRLGRGRYLASVSYQDRVLRDLPCRTLRCDEIWSYCYAKQKSVPQETPGHVRLWRYLDLDRDLRRHQARALVPSWLVGEPTIEDAPALS